MKSFLQKQSSKEYQSTQIVLLSGKFMSFCEMERTVVFCKEMQKLLRVGKWRELVNNHILFTTYNAGSSLWPFHYQTKFYKDP